LKKIIELKVQYEMAIAYQGYENLTAVASQIFGKPSHTDGAVEVQSFDQLESMIEKMTSGK
jgi:hypothetical protein